MDRKNAFKKFVKNNPHASTADYETWHQVFNEIYEEFLLYQKDMYYREVINKLNIELYEKSGDTQYIFNYATNGIVDIVYFGEIMLWSSEMDDREWIEEKNNREPLVPFLKKTLNQEIDNLQNCKL